MIGSFVAPGSAQSPVHDPRPTADRIVAIVGDKIILQSELEGNLAQLQRENNNAPLPPDTKCALLEQIMAQKVLVLQAERDSLPISDEDVNGAVENQIRAFIEMYGSKEKVEEVAGKSLYQIREDYKEPFRQRLLAEAMQKKINAEVKITPSEVQAYYEKIPKDSLIFYESELEVGQIVLNPKPSRELEKYAIDQLNEFKRQVETGERKFETLANLYSEDPGSKNNGGQYTLNRTEKQWDPDFLAAAFRLKNGEISPVVKTQFGYHIIQMVNRQGDNAVIRHILIIPKIVTADVNAALKKLDSIRAEIIAGKLTFGEAATKFSDDKNAKLTAGMFTNPRDGSTYLSIDQIPDKEVVLMLDSLKPGDISQPFTSHDQMGKIIARIIYLKSRSKPHRENLQDDYSKIQQRALQEKQAKAVDKWFLSKIPTFYIHLDDEFKNCSRLEKWKTAATAGR